MQAGDTTCCCCCCYVCAGGCKLGSIPADVVGDALVLEDSTTTNGKAIKASADCMLQGFSTYQYGGMTPDGGPMYPGKVQLSAQPGTSAPDRHVYEGLIIIL